MDWAWLVPIVVLAVYMLSNLLRKPEEPPVDLRNRVGGAPPKPKNEVDQFLEEINRMRRQMAEEQQRAKAQAEPTAAPAERPRPKPVQQAPVRRPVEKPRIERPRPKPAPVRLAQPARPTQMQTAVAQILDVLPVQAAAPSQLPPPPQPATRVLRRPPSAAVRQLRAMLSDPSTVQAAMVLNEVLGPPRCRRRPR